jgi:hypothetical protein
VRLEEWIESSPNEFSKSKKQGLKVQKLSTPV